MGASRDQGHRPFEILREIFETKGIELQPEPDKIALPPERVDPELSDEEAFEIAMNDGSIEALGWSETPLENRKRSAVPVWSDGEDEARRQLEEIVAGRGEMDPFAMGQGIEGASSPQGQRYLKRLKQGAFSIQGELDLHTLSVEDARTAVEQFLKRSQHRGLSCVRIVHGRGQHSPSEPHLMKTAVTKWLGSRKLQRTVVAFASARWRDGGSGAVYVLLYGKWRPAQR